jgi:hypothetical protein
LYCSLSCFLDTGDVLLRTPYEYKFVLQNRGEIDAHFTLVPTPSVSMEVARMEMGKGHGVPHFDVSGRGSMEERRMLREKREGGGDIHIKTSLKVEAADPDASSSSISTDTHPNSRPAPFLKASQRADVDPGSLALRAPPTTSEVMKATRPPIIIAPESGIIPPHQQVNLKVSFFPERLCGGRESGCGWIVGWIFFGMCG